MHALICFWLYLGATKLEATKPVGIVAEPTVPVTKRHGNHMSQFAWGTPGLELSHHKVLIALILLSKASWFEE